MEDDREPSGPSRAELVAVIARLRHEIQLQAMDLARLERMTAEQGRVLAQVRAAGVRVSPNCEPEARGRMTAWRWLQLSVIFSLGTVPFAVGMGILPLQDFLAALDRTLWLVGWVAIVGLGALSFGCAVMVIVSLVCRGVRQVEPEGEGR